MTYTEVGKRVKEDEAFALQCDMETLSLRDNTGWTVAHVAAKWHEAFALQCDMETLSLSDNDGRTVAHVAVANHEAFAKKHKC